MVSLHQLIQERFGVRTRSPENRENVAMTTMEALVLRNDSSRLAAVIINLGQTDVFIRPRSGVSATVGIRIGANGGTFSLQWDEDFDLTGKEWFGVTLVGTSTLYTLEVLVEPGGAETLA